MSESVIQRDATHLKREKTKQQTKQTGKFTTFFCTKVDYIHMYVVTVLQTPETSVYGRRKKVVVLPKKIPRPVLLLFDAETLRRNTIKLFSFFCPV